LDVETAISLSYNLLPDRAKRYFRMLAVFEGPFWVQSAAAVWGFMDEAEAGMAQEEADFYLGVLLTRNLISAEIIPFRRLDTDDIKHMGFYTLHDITWLFALNRLSETEDQFSQAVERHARFFAGLAIRADQEYKKGFDHTIIGIRLFHSIWPYLSTAWNTMQGNRKGWPRPPESDVWLSTFPINCAELLALLIPPTGRIEIFRVALEYSRRLNDRYLEGGHLLNLGGAYEQIGEIPKSIELLEEALRIAREIDNPMLEANAINNLGISYMGLNKKGTAAEYFEETLEKYDKIGDRPGKASTLANLSAIYLELGHESKAFEYAEQGLLISQDIGSRRLEAVCLHNLGEVHLARHEIEKAISHFEKALEITKELNDKSGQGHAFGSLGIAYAQLGEYSRAIEYYEKQLETTEETGDRQAKISALANLCQIQVSLGNIDKAIVFLEQALPVAQTIGDRASESMLLAKLGSAYELLRDQVNAIRAWREALSIYKTIGDDQGAQEAQRHIDTQIGGGIVQDSAGRDMTAPDLVRAVMHAVRTKDPQAAYYFKAVSQMGRDFTFPEELQEVGKVLRMIVAGITNPDLSRLPEELAKLINEELEKSKDDVP
jgi:tetratricopeptide (TPR) repeat protein